MIKSVGATIWKFLWEDRLPILLQAVVWAGVLLLSLHLDGIKSVAERREQAFVAQVNTITEDSTSYNVKFSDFAYTIMQAELPNVMIRISREDRQNARVALMDNLVRQQADADGLRGDPSIAPLVEKYQTEVQNVLDLVRVTDDFVSLKPAFEASGKLIGAQKDLLAELKKKAKLTS